MEPVRFEEEQAALEKKIGHSIRRDELLSYLLYPEVFLKYDKFRKAYSDVSVLPTPPFFYGLKSGEEITVEIESGKIALSVARDRMVPGEVINIKTPNAVAGVRGTVVVAQVTYRQGPGGIQQPISDLWVMRGVVEATHTSPAGVPLNPEVSLAARESFNADPTTATKGSFTPEQIGTIVEGLQPNQYGDPGTASQGPARLEAMNNALSLLTGLTGQQLVAGVPRDITTPADTTPKQTVTEVMDSTSSPTALRTVSFQPTSSMITPQSVVVPPSVVPSSGPPDVSRDCDVRRPPGSRDYGLRNRDRR